MNKVLVAIAVLGSIVYLFFANMLPYPSGVVVKISLCVPLALLAWRHKRTLLACALLFSAVGDALLAIDGANLFVPALASFLITHVLYAAIFLKIGRTDPMVVSLARRTGMVLPIVFAVAYAILLWPHLGSLAVPVVLYIAAIVTMTVLSFRIKHVLVPLGAALFMASDSLIALEKFLMQTPWLGAAVWITYALAQLSIVGGLLRSPSNNVGVANHR